MFIPTYFNLLKVFNEKKNIYISNISQTIDQQIISLSPLTGDNLNIDRLKKKVFRIIP